MFIGAAQEEEEIKKDAAEILDGLAKHFAFLKVSEAMSSRNPFCKREKNSQYSRNSF